MLHAFNQKNARRIFLARHDEHTIEKAEDAATSMVFSPLAFMSAEQALRCLTTVTQAGSAAVCARDPFRHHVELWPSGLTAPSWNGDGRVTPCEPDLLVTFEFAAGPPVAFVGEMKWDWHMHQDDLAAELWREREAVRSRDRLVRQVPFVVAKKRYRPIQGVELLTWKDFAARLVALERAPAPSPSSIWAELVRTFLQAADQESFTGFRSELVRPEWTEPNAFWSQS
jgi:hypothetical protein